MYFFFLSFVFSESSTIQNSHSVKGVQDLTSQTKGMTLTVKVNGLKEKKGAIYLALYNESQKEHYPIKANLAERGIFQIVRSIPEEIVVSNLPVGTYALSAYHDIDHDGKLGTNLIGIPNEPMAASNDAKGTMGPPSFDDAKFSLEKNLNLTLNLQ